MKLDGGQSDGQSDTLHWIAVKSIQMSSPVAKVISPRLSINCGASFVVVTDAVVVMSLNRPVVECGVARNR